MNRQRIDAELQLRAALDSLWENDDEDEEDEQYDVDDVDVRKQHEQRGISLKVRLPASTTAASSSSSPPQQRLLSERGVLSQRDAFLSGYLTKEEGRLQKARQLSDPATRAAYFEAYADIGYSEYDSFDNPYDFYTPQAWRHDLERMQGTMRLQEPENVDPGEVHSLAELLDEGARLDFRAGRRRMERRAHRDRELRDRELRQPRREAAEVEDLGGAESLGTRITHFAHNSKTSASASLPQQQQQQASAHFSSFSSPSSSCFVYRDLQSDQIPPFMRHATTTAGINSNNNNDGVSEGWQEEEETGQAQNRQHEKKQQQQQEIGTLLAHEPLLTTVHDAAQFVQRQQAQQERRELGKQQNVPTMAERRLAAQRQVTSVRSSALGLSVAFDVSKT